MNLAETKFLDVQPNYSFTTSNPGESVTGFLLGDDTDAFHCSLLNGLVQGTVANANTRIGNKVYIKGIWINVGLYPDSRQMETIGGTNDDPTHRSLNPACRFVIYKHKQAEKGMPAHTDIFTGFPMVTASRNSVYYKDFDIVFDKLHQMVPTAAINETNIAVGPAWQSRFFLPIKQNISFKSTIWPGPDANWTYGGQNLGTGMGGYMSCFNLTSTDYQVLCFTDPGSNNCCRMTLQWKIIFADV